MWLIYEHIWGIMVGRNRMLQLRTILHKLSINHWGNGLWTRKGVWCQMQIPVASTVETVAGSSCQIRQHHFKSHQWEYCQFTSVVQLLSEEIIWKHQESEPNCEHLSCEIQPTKLNLTSGIKYYTSGGEKTVYVMRIHQHLPKITGLPGVKILSLITSVDALWVRPAFRALRKVLRFQVYLPGLRNEGRTSLCRPERPFPNKKKKGQCCPLWETVVD